MAPWIIWWTYLLAAVLVGVLLFHTWHRRAGQGAALRPAPISILVIVRDREDEIEAFMRPLLGGGIGGSPPRLDYELVMVDSGSSDDTWAILSRLAYRRPGVRVLRWQAGQGTDPFQAGRLICRHPVTVTVDLATGSDLRSARLTLARLISGVCSDGTDGSNPKTGTSTLAVQPDQDPAGP